MFIRSLLSPRILLILLIIGLGALYTAQSDGEWMFDDEQQIQHVTGFSSVADTFSLDCFGLFRPVKNLIFYTWTQTLPDNYRAWRLTAIGAYLCLIPLAYPFFGLFFDQKPWLQLLSTALWASAPAATTVVNWISSTNIIVGGYGFFLYFLWYEKAQNLQKSGPIGLAYGWMFLALLMLAFSCFSYEAAMAAPFLLLLKDYVRERDRLKDKRTWVFIFLSLFTLSLYFLLRKVHGGVNNFGVAPFIPTHSDLWVSLSSGWFYLVHAFRWIWPFGHQGLLIMFDPEAHKALVIGSALFVFGLGILLLLFRTRIPMPFLSLGWYGLALFPMANVIPLRNGPICDYYLFLPSLGLAVFFSWLVHSCVHTRFRNILIGTSMIWITAFLITTYKWNPYWKSKQGLAERTLEWQPENFVILSALAKGAIDAGSETMAEGLLEKAVKLAPWYSPLHYHRVMLLMNQRRFDEAVAILEDLLSAQNHMAKPFVFLAYIQDIHLGEWKKAESLLSAALDKPWDERYSKTGAMNLAYIYIKTGRQHFARLVYESLLDRYPTDSEILGKYHSLIDLNTVETEVLDPSQSL